MFKAVYDGHRDFTAIAVVGGKEGEISGAFPPCGVCRQEKRFLDISDLTEEEASVVTSVVEVLRKKHEA